MGLWSSPRLHSGSPEGSGAPFWEPRGCSLDVLGSVGLHSGSSGGLLGAMVGSSWPRLATWEPTVEFFIVFHAILGAIFDDFWEAKSIKKSKTNSIDFLIDFACNLELILEGIWSKF